MTKRNIDTQTESRVTWESLEGFARATIQGWLQDILDAEITELLGRAKSERRRDVDPQTGYRNGYGKPRRLAMGAGTIVVRRPRVRDLEERFESQVLPLFKRQTKEVTELLPRLYLHGLAHGDMDDALRGLLGDGASLSAGTVARLKEKWQAEYAAWANRRLDDLDVVYMWVDGVYVKAGIEKDKAALLVIVAALSDGRKVIVAMEAGQRESTESWSFVLRNLRERGLRAPRLVVGDGHLGIWGALANIYPGVQEQRCWNHRIVNVKDKLPKRLQEEGVALLKVIPYAPTAKEAAKRKATFEQWAKRNGCTPAAELLDKDWERMTAFYRFPKEHWGHLRTTNPVESPFAGLRLRTDAAKRFKKVENARALIWRLLMVAEKSFRRLTAPQLLQEVNNGAHYTDGIRTKDTTKESTLKSHAA